jgi:hypothetical protein
MGDGSSVKTPRHGEDLEKHILLARDRCGREVAQSVQSQTEVIWENDEKNNN